MLNDLKVALIGSQIDFITLDNFMENNGYYSVADAGVMENIKNDKNIYYTASIEGQDNILMSFDLLSNSFLNDDNNFYIEVTSIEIA